MSQRESGAPSAQDLIKRLQELVDAEPADNGHPLEWAVPAYYLGDVTAPAMATLRSGS